MLHEKNYGNILRWKDDFFMRVKKTSQDKEKLTAKCFKFADKQENLATK
jgi:hypothetical protein